jgi:sodium transport system ATP-binding protein
MNMRHQNHPAPEHLIEAVGLSKQFKGSDIWAVKDLSFQAGSGEIIGLIGENGAGKSTMLRMLATMLKPSSGKVSIDGYDTIHNPGEVRRSIGILFGQQSGLYERLSARENILYFADLNGLPYVAARRKLSEISSLLDMKEFLDRPAGTFSTGMRQKTLIARSIIHNPKVLMLDEPATGLDVTSARNIHSFISWCKELNKTVIFSSHDLGVVERLSDRVLLLHKGSLMGIGTPSELAGKETLEEHFFQVQDSVQ